MTCEEQAEALVDLFWRAVPTRVRPTAPNDWAVYGVLMLMRCAGLVESVLLLNRAGHVSNAEVLSRTLFEHVVTYLWLDQAPGKHVPRWLRKGHASTLQVDRELQSVQRTFLREEDRELLRRELQALDSSGVGELPNLAQMAKEVDDFTRQSHVVPPQCSLVAFYHLVFRCLSTSVHPRTTPLKRMILSKLQDGSVEIGRPEVTRDAHMKLMPILFGSALLNAAESAPWLEREAVRAVIPEALDA